MPHAPPGRAVNSHWAKYGSADSVSPNEQRGACSVQNAAGRQSPESGRSTALMFGVDIKNRKYDTTLPDTFRTTAGTVTFIGAGRIATSKHIPGLPVAPRRAANVESAKCDTTNKVTATGQGS
mmetsp:Transcript_82884/g.143944  ORF Transcript_82884/g.143944 Transcript_82884/m.143944 type:complete len:123 (-) Transcript_82884:709-1077(-)